MDRREHSAVELMVCLLALLAALLVALVFCWWYLRQKLERLRALWDDIYFRLRERCELVAELSQHLRRTLRTNPRVVDDIKYLLERMEVTNDPKTHAGIQNGLVLTVQTAVEQFHRSESFKLDKQLSDCMARIAVLDSRLAPLRDRYNDRVRRYNSLLNTLPFSLLSYMARVPERRLFAMLIPWWSTDAAAYGAVSADEIRQTLQNWRAPLILAPSQRAQWPTGPPVVRVADKLGRRRADAGQQEPVARDDFVPGERDDK